MADTDSTRSPAFQFYPKDFLSDGNQAGMSLQECGAYVRLLCVCWNEGSIPNNVTRLARLCGATPGQMQKLWPAVSVCFRENEWGRLVHPRLDKERSKQVEYKLLQSERGKLGGRPKKPPLSTEKATAFQNTKPEESQGKAGGNPDESSSSSSSSSSSFAFASSERKDTSVGSTPEARSKRPIFQGQRFVVFEWMLSDLARLLGANTDAFDLHAWFFELDARAETANILVPQRDGGKWLQERTQEEALRRGLPVAVPITSNPKTVGNVAAAARFVARGER